MPKKNLSGSDRKKNNLCALMGYTLPKLHKGKRWIVDFYAFDPATQRPERKRYYLSESDTKREKERKAAKIISVVTQKLHSGWNPWISEQNSRGFALLDDVLDRYLDYIGKGDRQKTKFSYGSRVNILREYIATMPLPIRYVYQFDTQFVCGFLDYIYLDRDCSARTRNNYRGWCSAFSCWLVERKYLESNPCTTISKIRETPKKRMALTEEMMHDLHRYLLACDKWFLLACMMEYYTMIRPTELSHIRIRDFSIAKQTVYVSGEFSKNKLNQNVAINDDIIKLMLDLGVFKAPGCYYLFGRGFKPSAKRNGPDQFNKRWVKVRKRLGWSDRYQFYSLKDSGIRDLANELGIIVAKDQARHKDVSTTNKYLGGHDMPVHSEPKKFKGGMR